VKDAQLIQQFCKGNVGAFNELVERWQPRIHRVAYRYFNSHDEAMDIGQKTLIKVYGKLHTLDDAVAFPSWIYRIANNLCLDESRRAGRRRKKPLESANNNPAAETTDQLLQQNDLGAILQQALQQLPPEQRMVVIMKEYEELKFTEIADALDAPESTVKSRLYTGLRKLNEIFTQWNINKEDLYYE
jgi:RNA polymerase sigma-70 factor (ECF subfamily)